MHAISSMRRNSTHQNFISTLVFCVAILFYSAIADIYLWLPPLFGFLFLHFVYLFQSSRYYSCAAFIVLLFAMEVDKEFYPGMLFVSYCLVYIFIFNRVVKTFKYAHMFEICYVLAVYVLHTILYGLLLSVMGESTTLSFMILPYILLEMLLVLVVRWILGIR